MVKVIWTKRALGQFERAINYIKEEQGVYYAKIVVEKILAATALLESSPKMVKVEPSLQHKKSEYRFIIVCSYKIIYRVASDRVVITMVCHTSRNPNKLRGV